MLELDTIHYTDLLTLCSLCEPQSIDMILCDLPYGTTACSWDEIIPFEPMWTEFKRVIKPRGAIVLTASQPFTTKLIASNLKMFRYSWVWAKSNGGGFLNANHQPLKRHEDVLVFYRELGTYIPQMGTGKPYRTRSASAGGTISNQSVAGWVTANTGTRYPTSILVFPSETGIHPTQKPTTLFEYLIRTYTQEGDTVLDPCVGSGTTAVAARNTGRRYIVGDSSAKYIELARKRIAAPYTPPLFTDDVKIAEITQ